MSILIFVPGSQFGNVVSAIEKDDRLDDVRKNCDLHIIQCTERMHAELDGNHRNFFPPKPLGAIVLPGDSLAANGHAGERLYLCLTSNVPEVSWVQQDLVKQVRNIL
jgi:hypothetical protein